jgi:hypothetical protein
MKLAYVGFVPKTIPDWEQFVPVPRAPSNYKDQVKIAEYVAAAAAKQAEEAAYNPLTGMFADVSVLLKGGEEYKESALAKDVPLLEALSAFDGVVCLGVFDMLRLAVTECIDRKGALDKSLHWAVLSDQLKLPILARTGHAPVIIDPARILGGTDCTPGAFCQRFKIRFSEPRLARSLALIAAKGADLLGL